MAGKIVLGTFLGSVMSQTQKVIWLWEIVLKGRNFSRFIDIGTWRGNLSFYFYLYCLNKKAEFYSFDVRKIWESPLAKELGFDKHFYQLDVFQNIEQVGKIIVKEGQTILFCDNGRKTREFNTFAPYLKVGDIIAVHDWITEVPPQSIEAVKVSCGLQEIFSKECDEEGLTRFFQKNA